MRVLAGRDAIIDVLKNKFVKAIHQDGVECHSVVVICSTHLRLYRDDGGCLEAGENSLLIC